MDDPFNEDDDWDSGVEMDKCLNDQGGYDHMTKSDRTAAMQLNSQRSRRANDIEHKKQTTREAIERMEVAVQRVECKSSLTHRLALVLTQLRRSVRSKRSHSVTCQESNWSSDASVSQPLRGGLVCIRPHQWCEAWSTRPSSSFAPAWTVRRQLRSGIAWWHRCC